MEPSSGWTLRDLGQKTLLTAECIRMRGQSSIITRQEGKNIPCLNPHGNNAIKAVFLTLGNLL